jgi:hypothetical protein
MRPSNSAKSWIVGVLVIALIAAALRAALLIGDVFPFNSDEAIVALMADHILQGDWPVFFYGQAYMGSLDATLVAGLFALMGKAVIWIRILQSVLFIAIIITSMQLTRKATGSVRASVVTGLLLAVPPVNMTLYTTVSLGGYGEAMLLGNFLLLIAFKWLEESETHYGWFGLWGLLAGLGLWAFGLTVVYVLPTAVVLIWKLKRTSLRISRIRKVLAAGTGILAGLAPLIYWGLRNSPQLLVDEFLGAAIRGTTQNTVLGGFVYRLVNLLLFGPTVTLGFRPPWSTDWLAPILSVFPLLFWSLLPASLVQKARNRKRLSDHSLVLAGVGACTVGGFLATPFGNDPSGRYFLPLYLMLALGAGFLYESLDSQLKLRHVLNILLGGTLLFHLWGNIVSGWFYEDGITTQFDAVTRIDHAYDQDLIDFLIQQEEWTGYTNYWVAYPLAYRSNEQLVFTPNLPYHPDLRYTERDNRYEPYQDIVSTAEQWAYITTHNRPLDEWLRQQLVSLGAQWDEIWIGDYHVFYRVQPPTSLESLGVIE